MKNICTLASMAVAATAICAAPWDDPAVSSQNRMEARTYLVDSARSISLDGKWSFAWEGSADGNIAKSDPSAIATPFSIDVPSCVETRGWGVPHYVNIRYPHGKDMLPSIPPKYNPVMLYRRRFSVPGEWKGRRIVLRFEGVSSCCEVWLNGARVGYFEDSRLPSEFDITSSAAAGGDNELTLRVRKWCDGSYIEDQDMIRYAGVFRSVSVYAEHMSGIRDFAFDSAPEKDGAWKCTLQVEAGVDVSATLLAADGGVAGEFVAAGRAEGSSAQTFFLRLGSPRLWSPEDPYLYTLVLSAKGIAEERRMKVGVRRCTVEGGLILLNGRPIKFKGVNRHEMNPENGYTLSCEEMREDAKLMRRANFNCVRMSHYPNDPRFYALCDEYGLLVCAEANVESHGVGYGDDCLPMRPEWHAPIVERNVRNVKFYRNHASVVMWSVGNETGWGDALVKSFKAVKAIDPVRPFHGLGWKRNAGVKSGRYPCHADFDGSDVTGDMYPAFAEMLKYKDHPKPYWLCEYECAMGNGMGNLKEYWDVFYSCDKLSGGCIWDWIDQAVWKPDGRGGRFLAYGGDHDEQPNDGPFCANGLLDAMRRPSAKLNEAKHVQQPIEVACADASTGEAELWNRYEFTFADAMLRGEWELVADGVRVDGGPLDVPHVAPRQRGALKLPRPKALGAPGAEKFYRVSFRQTKDEPWAPKGYEVAWNQLPFGKPAPAPKAPSAASVEKSEDGGSITVRWAGSEAVFSKAAGTLVALSLRGKRILAAAKGLVCGPQLQVERAFTDADNWMRRPFMEKGMSQLSSHPVEMRFTGSSVVSSVRITGAKSGGFVFRQTWTFGEDGSLAAECTVDPFGDVPALPRIGTLQLLDGSLENLTWYGRGPWENYVDRCEGCDVGLYRSTVTDQYVDYIRPQDCGGKTAVRWATLTDANGRGVKITCDAPFFMQALHFTREDLDQARHRPGEPRRHNPLVPRAEVCLSIDCRQMGLGCNNCGPIPLEQYRFPVCKTTWTLRFAPL